ncbi:MFS transporter [Limnobacter sp.]|uniref:MFS transporter n=1 Tax=Limnobacter sp. TaxID=2003368 RepID=UPI00258FAC58|nr:MFS transporter [Limnobacter sp.]
MSGTGNTSKLLSYGLLGCAVGMVAVPIYIQVPYLYSRVYGVPAAWVGSILLISRLIDAILDPIIGLWVDKPSSSSNRYKLPLLMAVPLLLGGMYVVFFPFGSGPTQHALSLLVGLLIVHLGYSFSTIAYQAWGAELGHTDKERSTFVAVREGVGILGVVFAVSFALDAHAELLYWGFAVSLLAGMGLLLKYAPQPNVRAGHHHSAALAGQVQLPSSWKAITKPLQNSPFRKLLGVFLFNGLAASLPATLVPFYLRDRLGLDESFQWVLGIYFLTGAGSTVFWVWLASRIGLAKSWLMGMIIVIPAFVIVVLLGKGDLYGYIVVCLLTGFALGADLSLPAALLAKIIEDNGERGMAEGTYFGLWNWVNKLCLALAPTVALGVLQWFNYSPASIDHNTVFQNPLIWMYALLPCALKVIAILMMSASGLVKQSASGQPKGELA